MEIIDKQIKTGSLVAKSGDALVGGNRYFWVSYDDENGPIFFVNDVRNGRTVYKQHGGNCLDMLRMAKFNKNLSGLKVDKDAKWVF